MENSKQTSIPTIEEICDKLSEAVFWRRESRILNVTDMRTGSYKVDNTGKLLTFTELEQLLKTNPNKLVKIYMLIIPANTKYKITQVYYETRNINGCISNCTTSCDIATGRDSQKASWSRLKAFDEQKLKEITGVVLTYKTHARFNSVLNTVEMVQVKEKDSYFTVALTESLLNSRLHISEQNRNQSTLGANQISREQAYTQLASALAGRTFNITPDCVSRYSKTNEILGINLNGTQIKKDIVKRLMQDKVCQFNGLSLTLDNRLIVKDAQQKSRLTPQQSTQLKELITSVMSNHTVIINTARHVLINNGMSAGRTGGMQNYGSDFIVFCDEEENYVKATAHSYNNGAPAIKLTLKAQWYDWPAKTKSIIISDLKDFTPNYVGKLMAEWYYRVHNSSTIY